MLLSKSNLSYDDMKKVVLLLLKTKEINYFDGLIDCTVDYLIDNEKCYETNFYRMNHKDIEISVEDGDLIHDIVWDLIMERVLKVGYNKDNNSWPFISLTRHGKQIVNDDVPVYDIDGMISYLTSKIESVDDILLRYFQECLTTYRVGAYFASTVMLGCATERAIIMLIESYTKWIGRKYPSELNKLNDCKDKFIATRFSVFEKNFIAKKDIISKDIYKSFELGIKPIFNIIRENRNDAGHPTGINVDQVDLSMWIHVARKHYVTIYKAISYFDEN